MFMNDNTLYESLDVSAHISGMPIGGLLEKINSVVKFTEDERMALNLGKCKKMVIDFCKNKSYIPPLEIMDTCLKALNRSNYWVCGSMTT